MDEIEFSKEQIRKKYILIRKNIKCKKEKSKIISDKINSEKDILIKSKFGVEEPVESEINFVHKNNIDLVIVPGLCFDKEKNRLGFGKGHYDRFLRNTNLKTIAICYREQILDKSLLPVTKYDVKVQRIITDYEIFE